MFHALAAADVSLWRRRPSRISPETCTLIKPDIHAAFSSTRRKPQRDYSGAVPTCASREAEGRLSESFLRKHRPIRYLWERRGPLTVAFSLSLELDLRPLGWGLRATLCPSL